MERKLKEDSVQFAVTPGVTIDEFNEKYNQIVWFLKDKYGHITDVKIGCHSYEYDDGEDHEEMIDINYKRYETDEELIRRINLSKIQKSEQEKRELKLLKQYIESYKDEAVKYIKELNLI